jgi:Flp pilus assembly protein TadG
MRSIFKLFHRLGRDTSGAALIEMTIALPVIISLMAGGVDFGIAITTQGTGSKSIRDAARYLATVPASSVCGWGLANAKSLAVYGKFGGVDGVDTPLIPGWAMAGGSNNNVELGSATDCTNPTIIQLQAKFPYSSIMLSAVLPGVTALTLTTQHQERQIGQ